MIELHGLSFAYPGGEYQLDIARLTIAAGETVAITGPSGIGKTTLLHLLAGILVPQAGTILANGHPLSGATDAARRRFRLRHIGMIFQEFELIDYLNVRDNLLWPYRLSAVLKLEQQVRQQAEQLAHAAGIGTHLERNVAQLSQGERQRVAVCRALLPRPGLILADEPSGNLDPANTDRILDLIFQQAAQSGASFVCITHERHFLNRFDRVLDFADFARSGA